LLFILVMEGLSLLFLEAHNDGKIFCITLDFLIKICHILFVDDVLILNIASLDEWNIIHECF